MTTRRTLLTAMAGAVMLSGAAAFAQTATDATAPAAASPAEGWHKPSPEAMQDLFEGRIAMIKTALKLTPDQEKLWAPVEQVMRDGAAARAKRMADMKGRHDEMGRMDLVGRLETASQRAGERAVATQKLADALKPLYATLNDEQKTVAMLLLEHGGRGHGHGRGHDMMGG